MYVDVAEGGVYAEGALPGLGGGGSDPAECELVEPEKGTGVAPGCGGGGPSSVVLLVSLIVRVGGGRV